MVNSLIIREHAPFFGLLVILSIILYPSLGFDYVWDDLALFIESVSLRAEDVILGITQPILPGTTYFRPAVLFTFFLEFRLGEPSPFLSHFVNGVIHLLNTCLVYLIAARLVGGWGSKLPIASAVIFSLHPALVEPVMWVAGRFDLMATMFVLLACISLWVKKIKLRLVLIGCCFFLALCSKEMAISFPFLWFYIRAKDMAVEGRVNLFSAISGVFNNRWLELIPILLAAGIYLVLRLSFMGAVYHQDGDILQLYAGEDRVYLVLSTFWFYAKAICFPFSGIGPIHQLIENVGLFQAFMGAILALSMLVVLIFAMFKKVNIYLVGILLIPITLMPVLHLIPLTIGGNIGHERFLVLPVAVFALLLPSSTVAFLSLVSQRAGTDLYPYGITVFSGLVMVSAFIWWSMSPNWKNNLTLWAWAYEKNKNFSFIHGSYMSALIHSSNLDMAKEFLAEIDAHEHKDRYFDRWVEIQRAIYFTRTFQYQEAIDTLDRVLEKLGAGPHEVVSRQGLSLEKYALDKRDSTGSAGYRGIYAAYAEAYISLRKFDLALESATIALFYQRDYAPSLLLKSMALFGVGSDEESKKFFLNAKESIIPSAREEVDNIFRQFYDQLCVEGGDLELPDVCHKSSVLFER